MTLAVSRSGDHICVVLTTLPANPGHGTLRMGGYLRDTLGQIDTPFRMTLCVTDPDVDFPDALNEVTRAFELCGVGWICQAYRIDLVRELPEAAPAPQTSLCAHALRSSGALKPLQAVD